jgi:hypothetical protein
VFLETEHPLYPTLSALIKSKRHIFKKPTIHTVGTNVKKRIKMQQCIKYIHDVPSRKEKTLSELGVLHYAIKFQSITLLQKLLFTEQKEHKIDVNCRFKKGKTPLHYLAKYHDSNDMTVVKVHFLFLTSVKKFHSF